MIPLFIQVYMEAVAQEGDGPTPGHPVAVVQHRTQYMARQSYTTLNFFDEMIRMIPLVIQIDMKALARKVIVQPPATL